MDPDLVFTLTLAASAAAGAAVSLVVIKLIHREVQRWRAVRMSHYVAAVGEMVSRGMVPSRPPAAWAEDPLFHDALADYALLVSGPDHQVVSSLVSGLGIDDVLLRRIRRPFPATTRLRSVSSLVDLADQSHVADLRDLLDDRSSHVRVHAVRGLARLDDVDSVPRILDIGASMTQWEAARVADALVEFGSEAVPSIVAWIGQETNRVGGSVEMVALAARMLGLIGDPDAEDALVDLLRSDQPDWRVAAASALEHTGGEAAVAPLVDALADDIWRVRARAATALGGLAHPGVASDLVPLLRDRVWWVRQNAAAALGNLPDGLEHLLAAMDGDDPYAADAALAELTTSGAVTQAAIRAAEGTAVAFDLSLLQRADAASAIAKGAVTE